MASTHLYSEAIEQFQQAVLGRHKDSDTRRLLNDFLFGKSNISTPDAAKAAASSLATDAEQKYGAVKIGKVEVVPKKWIDNVLGNIENIVAAGGFMMKNAPESVGMAWFAISLTLRAISNNYSLYALFGQGLTDITEVMIIIVHYDRLYDERQTTGFRASNLLDKLFRDTVSAYAAVLDFAFSVKKHMSGGALDKVRHAFKDFFNTQATKFQGKLSVIADLKGKVLESSQGAFQDKTMQQFGNVQVAIEQLQHNQSQTRELQLEQSHMLAGMREDFKAFRDSVKPKTTLEYLKDEFVANKKKLAPLPEPYSLINTILTTKHEDTCKWILQNDIYQTWSKFDKSAVLCLIGGPQSGKSTVLATIVQQLEMNEDPKAPFVNFVSCVGNDSSQTTALEGQKLSRICNTLLCQIYGLAGKDDGKISLLETCNQILRNPKSGNAGPLPPRSMQSDGRPDFVDTMGKLMTALQRDTVLIIDAVEALNCDDQVELHTNIEKLITDAAGPQKISVLIGSRLDSTFIQRSRETTTCIDVGSSNQADMETVLNSRFRELSGWSETEKQQAKESVLNKAGSRFGYIDDVAIPFLKQPFQRPIATFLSRLPAGMNENFEKAIQSMPQNYFELLRLAVTWSLLAPRKVTVKEIIEAYTGVYAVDEPNSATTIDTDDEAYDPKASALEIQQIREAGGPFLSTKIAENGQTMVKIQDVLQVRAFCEHAGELQPIPRKENVPVCDNCKSTMATPSRLNIDPKVAHFEIALVLLKHLNSPLFQKRFGLLKDPAAGSVSNYSLHPEGTDATESSEEQEAVGKGQSAPINDEVKSQDNSGQDSENSDADDTTNIHLPKGDLAEDANPAAGEKAGAAQAGEDSDNFSESSEDLDEEGLDFLKNIPEGIELSLYDREPELRCEINNWPYHLQEAEKLWLVEERKDSEIWTRLNRDVQEELKKFVNNQVVFQNWQKIWGSQRVDSLEDGPRSPLYLAASLGLITWVEDLLDNGADINEISGGRNIIQASAELAHIHQNVNLLRLLLQRGADPYHWEGCYFPALHLWLIQGNNVPVVKAFMDHGVNFDCKGFGGWTGLHAFAHQGNDVEAFKLIMHPKDPSKKPDINAEDNYGETPLHRLMWRRDVPLDMLEAFLAVEGIDVNHDDKNSQQPLIVASLWGSLDIVNLLLAAGAEVQDQDNIGLTALHAAAMGGHVKCIETLLAANIELDFKDKYGSTPLQHAAHRGRKAAAEFLVAKGSDINSTNNRNRTPFFNATRCRGGGQETAQFILTELKRGGYTASDINKVTKGGRTPLRQAAAHGFADVLRELLEYINESDNADVKGTINKGDNRQKRTPLHCAARRGDPDCIRLLIKYGADVTLEDIEGNTPLIMARELLAQRNESSCEEALLHLIDNDRQAAIADAELPSIAAARGSFRVLQKLHSLRADLHRTDSFGWTPLEHAKQLGHKEMVHFLKHETPWGSVFPSKWVDNNSLSVLDDDGLRLTYEKDGRICIVSDKPLPPGLERFYYEITLDNLGNNQEFAIGFCTQGASPHEFPGWIAKGKAPFATSWGYHSDDGHHHHRSDQTYVGETYGPGDTVGCGVDLETHRIWFTKNGKKLAHEFEGVKGRLFPVLGLNDPVSLKTNFGQESFLWKDEQLVNEVGSK